MQWEVNQMKTFYHLLEKINIGRQIIPLQLNQKHNLHPWPRRTTFSPNLPILRCCIEVGPELNTLSTLLLCPVGSKRNIHFFVSQSVRSCHTWTWVFCAVLTMSFEGSKGSIFNQRMVKNGRKEHTADVTGWTYDVREYIWICKLS